MLSKTSNKSDVVVYFAPLHHQGWCFHLAATEQGLCRITLPNESIDDLRHWVHRQIPNARLVEEVSPVRRYLEQLVAYFAGNRQAFDFPVDLHGTEFQKSVWKALTLIPYGQTRSYAEVAANIGRPQAVRAVGAANGANPLPIVFPCHRVIGKSGALTGYRGGLQLKTALLQLEGYNL